MDIRPVRHPQDLGSLEELFEVCRVADGHAPLGEHKYLDLVRGGGESTLGLIGEQDGAVIGYVHLSHNARAGVWGLEMAVHPLWRHRDVMEELVRRALEAVEGLGGGEVHLWAFQPRMASLLEGLGFRRGRELRQLRRSLPADASPDFPVSIQVRPFRVGVDEEAWLKVNNAAFAGHPENGCWDMGTLAERERQEWFDPEGFRMAWEAGELVGFCWTKLHPARVGEIYVIAVAPGQQGRGLGRALVLDGLEHLAKEAGAESAMLYVEASNQPALHLYRRLGFHLDHVDQCFLAEAGGRSGSPG